MVVGATASETVSGDEFSRLVRTGWLETEFVGV